MVKKVVNSQVAGNPPTTATTEATNAASCCSASEVYFKPTKKIEIDPFKCTACGTCAEVCPFGLPVKNFMGIYEIADVDSCVECGACQKNCPAGAIAMLEQEGCGCLWDTISRKRDGSALGCGCAPGNVASTKKGSCC